MLWLGMISNGGKNLLYCLMARQLFSWYASKIASDSSLKGFAAYTDSDWLCGSVDQLSCFIAFLSSRMCASSIMTYVKSLMFMCKFKCYSFPDISVAKLAYLLAGVRRTAVIQPRVRDPVLVSHMLKMYQVMSFKSIFDIQFLSACVLMFRALLRISNIVGVHAMSYNDVKFTSWGLLLCIHSTKASSSEHVIPVAAVKPVSLCPVFWLRLLLKNHHGGSVLFSRLSYNSFRTKLKVLLGSCAINSHISSHSFRSGGATFMAAKGIPVLDIKERGGWRSNCIFRYIREPLSYRIAKEKSFAKVF